MSESEPRLPFRLGRKLALMALLIGLLFVPLLSGLALWRSHSEQLMLRHEQIDEIAHASLPALREALWLGDEALVGSYLDGLMKFTDIVRVELRWAEDIKPLLVRGQRPAADVPIIERTLPISRTFKDREMVLGELTLQLSLARTKAQLRQEIWRVLFSLLLEIGLLTTLIVTIYQKLAGRRLLAMSAAMVRYRRGDSSARMAVAHRGEISAWDELDELAAEFNALIDAQQSLIDELREANQRLNEEVAERRKTQEALAQARDAAEAANRAKSIFLANMSHELRTPLNAILGFAQLMSRDERLPADQQHHLATINRSGQHLLALINDVLEISRIEAGRLTVQNQAFELAALIQPLIDVMALRASNKGLRLDFEMAADLPPFVEGDAVKLRQILLNLLSNAIKYTEHGSVLLRVESLPARPGDPIDGVRLRCAVRDTGVGIAQADLDRLFQPFFQADYGIRLGDGTGLGLTICYEYARLLGGELTVESAVGVGSTFAVSLPLRRAQAAEVNVLPTRRVARLAARQAVPRILIAEDNEDNRRLLLTLLEKTGFTVRAVADGAQAVAAFVDWRPDFIWLDMRMPVMDGFEAARRIRALPGGDAVKIVALTASAFQEDRGAILAAGCDDALAKPLDENRLFATMATLLGVHFEYFAALEETPVPLAAKPQEADLNVLPLELRRQLAAAARELDIAAVRALIEPLRVSEPACYAQLDRWLDGYRLDLIAALTKEDDRA